MSDITTRQKASLIPKRKLRFILLVVVPVFAIFAIAIIYLMSGHSVETDNAYVKADKIPVSPEVSGVIQTVLVHENQNVHTGDVLYRIDPAPFKVSLDKAEAKLAQVGTELAALKASYYEKKSEINLAKTKSSFANKEEKRQADLVANHYTPTSSFDGAKQTADIAIQEIHTLEQDLNRISESLGGDVNAPIKNHPTYRGALAELEQAQLDLDRVQIKATSDGIVSKLPKQGQFVSAGISTLVLVVNDHPWVEANFPEKDLTYIQAGQSVSIQIDTYPDVHFKGEVESLSPATGSEFSVIPAQNATGNWVKISQRVPVRIRLLVGDDQPQLQAGLSTTVEIETGHRRDILGFTL
jgi:membrane fusion protein (multidrug efflux system)